MYALYGNITLKRAYCSKCKQQAFIIEDKYSCCERKAYFNSKRTKRMSLTHDIRKAPSELQKKEILDSQNHKCLYCENRFGAMYVRDGITKALKIEFDHLIPYSFSANNYIYNFVAACNVCNGLKSSLMFQTLDEAKIYIQNEWKHKNIKCLGGS